MSMRVFISYARRASAAEARQLFQTLNQREQGSCFLDEHDIGMGAQFPNELLEALLDSQCVIILLTREYLERWYCILEKRLALQPFRLAQEVGASENPVQYLEPIVIGLPSTEEVAALLASFPSALRLTNWPSASDVHALADLAWERIEKNPPTLRHLLLQLGDGPAVVAASQEMLRLPPPSSLTEVATVPPTLPLSLDEVFVGRADDLWRLDEELVQRTREVGTRQAVTVSLEGFGGLGKTRIAAEYVRRYAGNRFKTIYWLDGELDPTSYKKRLFQALTLLTSEHRGLDKYDGTEGDSLLREDLALALRARTDRHQHLFIVDNVPEASPESVPVDLTWLCPVIGLCPVLFTSRQSLRLMAPMIPIALHPLGSTDGLLLLQSRVPPGLVSEEGGREIVQWAGGHPLALVLLNAMLRVGAITEGELRRTIRSHSSTAILDHAVEALRNAVPSNVLRGISETLIISYKKLTPDAQEAARAIAFLAPEPIPDLVVAALRTLLPDSVRASLVGRSFVSLSNDPSELGAMHRVLADFLRNQETSPLATLQTLAVALLNTVTRDARYDPRRLSDLDRLTPHILSVIGHLARLPEGVGRNGTMLELADAVGELLINTGLREEALRIVEGALEACGSRLSPIEPYLRTRSQRARLLYLVGRSNDASDAQAAIHGETAKEFGVNSREELLANARLAGYLSACGRDAEAIAILGSVVETRAEFYPDEEDTVSARTNYGAALLRAGRHPEALQQLRPAVHDYTRLLGGNNLETLRARNTLGAALAAAEDPGAVSYLSELLGDMESVLAPHHTEVLQVMANLTLALISQGAREEGVGVGTALIRRAAENGTAVAQEIALRTREVIEG